MLRSAAFLLLVAAAWQDPADPTPRFQQLLEAAEKTGLLVPDLPEAVGRLDALARDPKIPPALLHRYQTLRAQAAILARLHASLAKTVGNQVEMPLPPGKPLKVNIVEVRKRGLVIRRPEGLQELSWPEVDPEWAVAFVRADLPAGAEGSLLAGLYLARAARWEAALGELRKSDSTHPLVIEARRRGLEGILKQAESAAAGRRWREAVERLRTAAEISPQEAALDAARRRVLAGLVEQGKEHSRKKSTSAMEEIIDLIVKNFPEADRAPAEIREEVRWIAVTDPAKFGLTGRIGQPFLVNPADEPVKGFYLKDVPGTFDGVSILVRFTTIPKQTHVGPIWDGRAGRLHAWLIRDNPLLMFAQLEEKAHHWNVFFEKGVDAADSFEIRVLLERGEYVVSVNGAEAGRAKAAETEMKSMGIQASHGRAWIDRFRLRKKE